MIRVSVETHEHYKYRLKPIVDLRHRFMERGFLVGFDLSNADLRIVHQDVAVEALGSDPGKRLAAPLIVDEQIDEAGIHNELAIRSALAHPDVKLWLKRNNFRDFRMNNEEALLASYNEACVMPVTPEMANKIRLLPTACIDLFAFFREQTIDWKAKRPIDVMFAGIVDYEVRATDYWDGVLQQALAAPSDPGLADAGRHRRAAVRSLIELRHLRVLIGINRAVPRDLYATAMMRSSISLSPYGLGEYAFRDYESILAGCILVKPPMDHIETFAPDIYQSNKYYLPCKQDFSDLDEVIERIREDRERAIEMAARARRDLLEANTSERLVEYFLRLFEEALGRSVVEAAAAEQLSSPPRLSVSDGPPTPVRAEIARVATPSGPFGAETIFVLTEDSSKKNSHDIRLAAAVPFAPGLYRVRTAMRGRGRRKAMLQLHLKYKDQIGVTINLDQGQATTELRGTTFRLVYGPEVRRSHGGWVATTFAVELTNFVEDGLGLVLYASDDAGGIYYDGDGRAALEVGALDFERLVLQR